MRKEQSVEELKREISKLKLQKEKELLKANTMKEKEKLMSDIAMLKKAQKRPSNFKKGLGMISKGIGQTWKGIQKASRNYEMNKPKSKQTQRQKKMMRKTVYPTKNEIPWGLP